MEQKVCRFTGPRAQGWNDRRAAPKTITKRDIELFGEVSTDTNPMHFDEEYAATTQFGRCIAHGVISLSLLRRPSSACSCPVSAPSTWGRRSLLRSPFTPAIPSLHTAKSPI